jgi:hypothetical protein
MKKKGGEIMTLISWVNRNGQQDFQECVDANDVRQCIQKVVLPGGGVRSSVRIHKISETFELDKDLNLIKGRKCVADSFMLK